jgi:hypothetical protein
LLVGVKRRINLLSTNANALALMGITAPALGRYQRGRGIDPTRREMVGERPSNWVKEVPTSTCEHCGMVVKGNQWTFRQHQQTKRYLANRDKAA